MDEIVTELMGEGMSNAWAVMINHPLAAGGIPDLVPLNARIPALQDTLTAQGGLVPAVGALLNCLDPYQFLIVDEGGYATHKTQLGGDLDLRRPDGRDTVEQWMRDLSNAGGCGGASNQFAMLQTLVAECAAAGVAIEAVALTPPDDVCLRRALQDAGSPLAVLQDAPQGVFAELQARRGELMLLDSQGRIRRRLWTGAANGRDVDLTRAADRTRVIEVLQEIPPTR
jgi:hypothetical protein